MGHMTSQCAWLAAQGSSLPMSLLSLSVHCAQEAGTRMKVGRFRALYAQLASSRPKQANLIALFVNHALTLVCPQMDVRRHSKGPALIAPLGSLSTLRSNTAAHALRTSMQAPPMPRAVLIALQASIKIPVAFHIWWRVKWVSSKWGSLENPSLGSRSSAKANGRFRHCSLRNNTKK